MISLEPIDNVHVYVIVICMDASDHCSLIPDILSDELDNFFTVQSSCQELQLHCEMARNQETKVENKWN